MTHRTLPLDPDALTGDALRDLVRQRLQGEPAGGPAVDPRGEDRPYEWLLDSYREARSGTQQRLSRVFAELLPEALGAAPWPEPAQVELLDLLQGAGDASLDPALWAALRRYPEPLDAATATQVGRLLKVLLARGHRGSPAFWLEWLDRLGPDFGALMLSGLLEHGPDQVAAHLPRLVASPKALRAVLRFLPSLEDRWGQGTLLDVLRSGLQGCTPETAEHFWKRYPDLAPERAEVAAAAQPEHAANDAHRASLWALPPRETSYKAHRGWFEGDAVVEYAGMIRMVVASSHPSRLN